MTRFHTAIGSVVALACAAVGVPDVAAQNAVTRRGSVTAPATRLAIDGDLLAAAAGTTVRIIDVSDPERPEVVGTHELADNVLGLALRGNDLYVANGHEGLYHLDVSTPSASVARQVSTTRGQAVGVALMANTAFVADNSLGFDVVDLNGDGRVGEYLGDGFPRAIGAAGGLVFVADQPNGLIVLDPSNRSMPEPVGGLSLGADMITRVMVPRTAGTAAPRLIGVASGGAGLQVVDVSTPSAPSLTARVPTSGRPRGVALDGDHLFAISDGALEIFDLSDPSRPTRTDSHPVGETAGQLAVSDALVVVAAGDQLSLFSR